MAVSVNGVSQYRLPDDNYTADLDQYVNAWQDLANKVISFFPGYVVSGFNPDFTFVKYGTNRFGQHVALNSFTLSVEAVKALQVPKGYHYG